MPENVSDSAQTNTTGPWNSSNTDAISCSSNTSSNTTLDDLMSEFRLTVFPLTIYTGFICIFGIIGNITVLYVHMFKYKRCNFSYFVLGLCAVDLTAGTVLVPLEMYTQMNFYQSRNAVLCKISSFVSVSTSVAMVLILLMIAVDRFRKVMVPHGWQICKRHVQIGFVAIMITAVVNAFPVAIVWGKNERCVMYKDAVIKVCTCGKDESFEDTIWPMVYVVSLIPNYIIMGVMMILYAIVFRLLYKIARRKMKRNISNDSLDNHSRTGASMKQAELVRTLSKEEKNRLNSTEQSKCNIGHIGHQVSFDRTLNSTEQAKCNSGHIGHQVSFDRIVDTDFDTDASTMSKNTAASKVSQDGLEKNSNSNKSKFEHKLARIRRITWITFVFTFSFLSTAICYMVISAKMASLPNKILPVHLPRQVAFMFGFRVYFIHYAMHPILYGFLDPNFRRALSSVRNNRAYSLRPTTEL